MRKNESIFLANFFMNILEQLLSKRGRYSLLVIVMAVNSQGATLPDSFAETRLATGLDPTSLSFAPDGRLFLTEKSGQVRILKNGALLATPFLILSNINNANERGLQSIAFDPNFANNQYVYLFYTANTPTVHNRVSRFTANGDVVVAGSETIIVDLENLSAGNHNGGGLFFKDGYLFITTGENAVPNNAQSLNNRLGKVLRLNADGSIPTDNPFYNTATGANRAIWALGLRNPFKAAIQPTTGKVFINDVGGNSWEEIDEAVAGKNYGWPGIEGARSGQTPPTNYQDPFYAYDHSQGCSITAGTFYNPTTAQFPSSYTGKYFFADYCDGYLKTLDPSSGAVADFASDINRPVDLAVGPDGSLYYLARGGLGGGSVEDNTSSSNGELWRVEYTNSTLPTISAQPANRTVSVGGTTSFTVGASGSSLFYQWQKNGTNISGATSPTYTINNAQSFNAGRYRVLVSNSAGSVTSNEATLTVSLNQPSVADITSPSDGSLYRAGDAVSFSGSDSDGEDGPLPASAYSWEVVFHHDTHTHPGPSVSVASDGQSGSFEIPTEGETSANVWYRLFLTVTDSQGASGKDSIDIDPRVVTVSLASSPAGLQLTLDGQPRTTPYSQPFVSGMLLSLSAPSAQTLEGTSYSFSNWSGGLGSGGSFTVPDNNITYTANFQAPRNPDNPNNTVAGLDYEYYEGTWNNLPDFGSLTSAQAGTVANIDLGPRNRDDDFGFQFRGYVDVPADGVYTFYTSSDDGSKLFIGNTLVVDNDGLHSSGEQSGAINLKAGKHAITVDFFEQTGDQVLNVSYQGPNISKQLVPATAWFRYDDSNNSTVTLLLEAEEAESSGLQTSAIHTGYFGTGFADYLHSTGDYLEWTVKVPTAGMYNLGFRYALGTSSDRPLEIKVNGAVNQVGLSFPTTDNWANWSLVSTSASLNAGENTVRATAIGSSGANVDRLEVTSATTGRVARGEQTAEPFVQYYPVPVSDVLTIDTDVPLEGAIRLMDAKGAVVKSFATKRGQTHAELGVKDVRNGLYLVAVPVAGRLLVKKVAVQR